jgi:hypothetical protein
MVAASKEDREKAHEILDKAHRNYCAAIEALAKANAAGIGCK